MAIVRNGSSPAAFQRHPAALKVVATELVVMAESAEFDSYFEGYSPALVAADIEYMSEELNNLYAYLEQTIDKEIAGICATIIDPPTVDAALYAYDINYFRALPWSPKGKQALAQALIDKVIEVKTNQVPPVSVEDVAIPDIWQALSRLEGNAIRDTSFKFIED